ncbi:MAG: hypothetical protein IKE48_04090 [Parasporobacterium sp.]|nr:hypothetical protein [Parasporobacterium sp.]
MKKSLKTPVSTIILFIVAAALILAGAIGGTLALLNIFSEQYNSQVRLRDIGVSLYENGEMVGERDYSQDSSDWIIGGSHVLCENLLGEDSELKIGKNYKEALSVYNSGNIPEYVRLKIHKYWAEIDEDGNIVKKLPTMDPSLIDLHLVESGDWIQAASDIDAFSPEMTVLYYTKPLAPEEETSIATDLLTIKDVVAKKVTEETHKDAEGYTVITTTYEYDGVMFVLEAQVDAVQTHNAEAAILSAWGKNVTVSGGIITNIQ